MVNYPAGAIFACAVVRVGRVCVCAEFPFCERINYLSCPALNVRVLSLYCVKFFPCDRLTVR